MFAIDDTKDADTIDNKTEDLPKHQTELNKITDIEDLRDYYKKNEGLGVKFGEMVSRRKIEINEN